MKVAVVTRQLQGCKQVVSAVIKPPHDYTPHDSSFHIDSYLFNMAEDHVEDFKKRFVEFGSADWQITLIETGGAI